MTEKTGQKTDRETIIAWATAAKAQAGEADLDPMPRDESFMRAAVAFEMLTRGPWPVMSVVADKAIGEDFNRSAAIVNIAINIDDTPASTPHRAALFATVLEAT